MPKGKPKKILRVLFKSRGCTMHKYQLAIQTYDLSPKNKSDSIMKIIDYYKGEIDDATEYAIYIGFPIEINQLCANSELHKMGVCGDIWIEGVRK
jgi:hypothetical protein